MKYILIIIGVVWRLFTAVSGGVSGLMFWHVVRVGDEIEIGSRRPARIFKPGGKRVALF